jgi:hemerythrin
MSGEMPIGTEQIQDTGFRPPGQGDLMVWNRKCSVGVASIDRQHHALFDAINDLQAAVINRENRETIGALLSRVAEGTRAHFASEEGMMAASKYAGMALHAFKHQHLLQQVDAFSARFNRGFELNEHSLNFIRDWFLPHILEADSNFGLWHNEHCKY